MTTQQGTIAFITTPVYRQERRRKAERFILTHMYSLCRHFDVVCTGRTKDFIHEIIAAEPDPADTSRICDDLNCDKLTPELLEQWRTTIRENTEHNAEAHSVPGMICVTHRLVEGYVDAVIHLADWQDKSAKADSAVLSRQANVHDVPIALDLATADAYAKTWKGAIARGVTKLFPTRNHPTPSPVGNLDLDAEEDEVLAMIAHDQMKLDLCCFAVRHADLIFKKYKYILATGTTGGWLQNFMAACGRDAEAIGRIRRCNSGPYGGDVQIAYAVVKDLCNDVVFFQDPMVAHAHDSDIRLFEQAVVHRDISVRLATNVESAKLLIG